MESIKGFDYTEDGSKVAIVGYRGSASQIWVPDEIRGMPVTKIDREAFSNCETLREIVIPNGVIEIGNYAFEACKNLIKVELPDSILKIGLNPFLGSSRVKITYKGKQYYYEQTDALAHAIEVNERATYGLEDLEHDSKTLMEVMMVRQDYREWFEKTFPNGASSAADVLGALRGGPSHTPNVEPRGNVDDFSQQLRGLVEFLSQTAEHEQWFRETFPNGTPSISGALLQLIGQYNF